MVRAEKAQMEKHVFVDAEIFGRDVFCLVGVDDGIGAFCLDKMNVADAQRADGVFIRNDHFFILEGEFLKIGKEVFDLEFIIAMVDHAARFFDGCHQVVRIDGFEEKINRAEFEGVDGIFVVGGHKDDEKVILI